jgi:hypothetical protein
MGVKRPRDFILTLEDDDPASQSDTESEAEEVANKKKRKVDDELNPDFEFDGYGVLGGVTGIEDDGWGFKGVTGMREGAGVDLDGIIARRRGNMAVEEDGSVDSEEDEDEDDNEDLVAEDSEEEQEFNGFDDDEEIGISPLTFIDVQTKTDSEWVLIATRKTNKTESPIPTSNQSK